MNFSQWLEALNYQDVMHGVDIQPYGEGFKGSFFVNNEEYKVTFMPEVMRIASKPGDGFYPSKRSLLQAKDNFVITLIGPNLHSPTNRQVPFTVYSNSLAIIKRFIEIKNPAGLAFGGYTLAMDVLYNKFYDKYLKPMYTRIDKENYLRNDLVSKFELDPDRADRANQYFSGLRRAKLLYKKEIADTFK